jgi:hypothetical protein
MAKSKSQVRMVGVGDHCLSSSTVSNIIGSIIDNEINTRYLIDINFQPFHPRQFSAIATTRRGRQHFIDVVVVQPAAAASATVQFQTTRQRHQ